jgi:hypothetical protein
VTRGTGGDNESELQKGGAGQDENILRQHVLRRNNVNCL